MRRLAILVVACCAAGLIAAPPSAAADLQALCVPWQPATPSVPHYTYNGAEITLKGIVRGSAAEFRWDFGDGTGTSWASITDPYNLGVRHTYTGAVGQLFIATTATACTG